MPASCRSCWRKSPKKRRLKGLSAMVPTIQRSPVRPLPGAARWRSYLPWKAPCTGLPARPGRYKRDEAIEHIAQSGKRDWKDKSGYHRRSLIVAEKHIQSILAIQSKRSACQRDCAPIWQCSAPPDARS